MLEGLVMRTGGVGARPTLFRGISLAFFAALAFCTLAQVDEARLDFRSRMGRNPLFGLPGGPPGDESPSLVNNYGIDISYWNGTINFAQVKTAASFIIMRASYGANSVDSSFGSYRTAAQAQDIPLGFYHYSYPQLNSATAEANNFLNRIGTLQTGQVVVLDYEESWSGDAVGWCKTWLDTVYAATGVKPFLYINLNYNNLYNWSPVVNAGYPLWLARWDYNRDANPPATDWPFCKLRQYSNSESIPGISGNVDGNTFYGTIAEFKAFGKAGAGATWLPPVPGSTWYRTNELFSYSATGTTGFTVKTMINGVEKASSSAASGSFGLFLDPVDGWKEIWMRVVNPDNTTAESTHLFCGLDRVNPVIALGGGAQPSQWYTADTNVLFSAPDAHSGLKRWRYRWDTQAFGAWVTGAPTPIPLTQGKHRLTIEAEDLAFAGTTSAGNVNRLDLGEFWLDTVPHTLTLGVDVLATRSPQIRITLGNPNISPSNNVVVDSVKLGTVSQPGNWTLGTLVEGTSASKVYEFTNLRRRAAQLLVVQARIGSTPYTLQQWVAVP